MILTYFFNVFRSIIG